MTENVETETENEIPSVVKQIAGAAIGVAVVVTALRTAVAIQRARYNRRHPDLWTECTIEGQEAAKK